MTLISDSGCSGLEKSIYDAETVSSLDSVSVTSVRILNNSFLWRFPLQIEVLIHLLSCYRLFGNGYCFHLYTLKGIPIKHFAHKGSGHGKTFVC